MLRPGCSAGCRWLLLIGTAAVLLSCALALGLGSASLAVWTRTIIAASVLGGVLVIATTMAWRRVQINPWLLVGALVCGIGLRLALIPAGHFLSDDAFRYRWDGKVFWHGISPYRYAPADPRLDQLRTGPLDHLVARPDLRTVYPPLAEAFFALGHALAPDSLRGLQALMLLSELAAWLLLLVELRRRGLPSASLLLMAWSPLLIFEGYVPGHVDMLMLPFLVLFLMAIERRSPWASAAALALACLVKPHAAIFAPAALRQLGVRRGVIFGVVSLALFSGALLPFLLSGAGFEMFSSLGLMARHWAFNGSLAALIRSVLPRDTTRVVSAVLLAMLLIASAWRGRDNLSRMLLAVAAFVICTPNLFPWYLFLMLPLLVLRPDPALLTLGVLIPITETVTLNWQLTGTWQQSPWQQVVEYAPFYAVLGLSALRRWGMFRGDAAR